MDKKTNFNLNWVNPKINPSWSKWLKPDESDRRKGFCSICRSIINLSNMGKAAIISHERGDKHKRNVHALSSSPNIAAFFEKSSDKIPTVNFTPDFSNNDCRKDEFMPPSECLNISQSKSTDLKAYIIPDDISRAEIIWCLNVVDNHISLRSGAKCIDAIKLMDPNSEIIKKLKLQKDKISYMITFVLGPFFTTELFKTVSECENFVVCFDESLNKITQKQQMDIIIRYYENENNKVITRYLTSGFLGHSCATDLYDAFVGALNDLNVKKVLQISMDGPAVNWAFIKMFKKIQKDNESPEIIEIGSCGLHVVHGAFKTGEKSTSWCIISFLRSIYNLFKNVPARRADYIHYSESMVFPLKFCEVRWIENAVVAKRAEEIIPNLRKYVEGVVKDKKTPICQSFKNMVEALKDPLLPAQLSFFHSVAMDIEPFLTEFQSDSEEET